MVRRTKKRTFLKKKLNTFDKVILVLNILAAIAILLSYFSPITDPRNFMVIAVLGFGYQVLLLINLIFIVYWVIRLKVFVLISAISILLGFNLLIANYQFGGNLPTNKEKQFKDIRMMNYNVRSFYGITTVAEPPILTPRISCRC